MSHPTPPNIVEIATGSDDFNLLVRALATAGLVAAVREANDITVFAPTDSAFTRLAADLGFDGDSANEDDVFDFLVGALTELGDGNPIPLLRDVLLYHVSPGAKSATQVEAADAVPTLLAGATFGSEGKELVDNEPDVANPSIVIPDIPAANGTIQVIDRVLLPLDIPGNEPANIVDIAAGSEDFNLLVRALDTAGLTDIVRDADDITVFAPTDAAFTQLAVDLGFDGDAKDEGAVFDFIVASLTDLGNGDPLPLLTNVLLYHVSPGAKTAKEVDRLDEVPTLLNGATFGSEGSELIDNEPDVANPNIVIPDVGAANGTIQAIDRVLIPIDIPGNEPANMIKGTNRSDHIAGTDAADEIFGRAGRDDIDAGAGNDIVSGGRGRDHITGGEGNDQISGNRGRDRLFGEDGNDSLNGGRGRDVLVGGDGDDELIGGRDRDILVGGDGGDTFVFGRHSGRDVVRDFDPGHDMITLEGLYFANVHEVLDAAREIKNGVVIDFGEGGHDRVKLLGVHKDELSDDNISLVS